MAHSNAVETNDSSPRQGETSWSGSRPLGRPRLLGRNGLIADGMRGGERRGNWMNESTEVVKRRKWKKRREEKKRKAGLE